MSGKATSDVATNLQRKCDESATDPEVLPANRPTAVWTCPVSDTGVRAACETAGSGLAELEAVAERVGDVGSVDAGERDVRAGRDAGGGQAVDERRQVVHDQTWMGLSRRGERLFDAHMQLARTGAEPAAASGSQRLRLLELFE